MPDLAQSLQGRDLGHLRIVADLWGVALNAPDARVGVQRLVLSLLEQGLVAEMIGDLPTEARAALSDLIQHEGRLPWSLFTRRYGIVREMGPARRDRELPHRKPASPAEMLWYRALVGRAFFDADAGGGEPRGPEEFAYIPEDLISLIPLLHDASLAPLGRPATPVERAHLIPANDRLLDQATTCLAALRMGRPWPPDKETRRDDEVLPAELLPSLLTAAGLLDSAGQPLPDPTRAFLEAPRGEALAILARAWLNSPVIDELRLTPSLRCEGEWQNDALRARRAALDFLSTIPGSRGEVESSPFWSLSAFVADIRQRHPDFQRPAGDYDSWFIRDAQSGEFLRGFDHWDQVDGAMLRWLVVCPLHALGILDLAAPTPQATAATAFRFSPWGSALLRGAAPEGLPKEDQPLQARSDGRLRLPRLAPRPLRYQIARFAEWEVEQSDAYLYRLTPEALGRARQQGLTLAHLLALLRRYADVVPPSLVKALERWEAHGSEARIDQVWVLRLASPELLQALRASRASRFLGEPLSATAILVRPGAAEKVLQALAEMGYLGELKIDRGE